jgi:hypothetical protein
MSFPFGELVTVHHIPGLSPITEYIEGPDWGPPQTQFSTGGYSHDTLDEAIVHLLAEKYGTIEATPYIWKLLTP